MFVVGAVSGGSGSGSVWCLVACFCGARRVRCPCDGDGSSVRPESCINARACVPCFQDSAVQTRGMDKSDARPGEQDRERRRDLARVFSAPEKVESVGEDGAVRIPEEYREFLLQTDEVKFSMNGRGEIVLKPVEDPKNVQGMLKDDTNGAATPTAHLRADREYEKRDLEKKAERTSGVEERDK